MSKKFIAVLLAVVLGCSMFSFAASAASVNVQAGVKYQVAETLVAKANTQILNLVKVAQATDKNDVAWLVKVTNAVAKATIKATAALGVTVVCEYEYFWVDGQYVAVDPLKVAY